MKQKEWRKLSRQAAEIIDTCSDSEFSMLNASWVARRLEVTPEHLSRVFKEDSGYNLKEHIERARIGKACLLLETTDMLVKEIGELVGYASPAYFGMVFRRQRGLSPIEHRERIKAGVDPQVESVPEPLPESRWETLKKRIIKFFTAKIFF